MTGFKLKSVEFRREREEAWEELEALLDKAARLGPSGLSAEELHRLPVLYRSALSSLSVARSISLDRRLVAYLEGLATRAYLEVYGVKRRFGDALLHFYQVRWPALLFQHRLRLLGALLTLALGTLVGFWLTVADPEWFYSFVPEGLAGERGPLSSRGELEDALTTKVEELEGLDVFTSFLFSHNSRVGMFCFFLGFAGGVPSAMLLFSTGLMLGAFTAIHHLHGLDWLWWTWLLPHGVTELLAICVCGAAGFAVGEALVFPGRHGRLAGLAQSGREGGQLVLGAISMLFVAAWIEGFFRQLVTDPSLRASVICGSLLFWTWYIAGVGGRAFRQRNPG